MGRLEKILDDLIDPLSSKFVTLPLQDVCSLPPFHTDLPALKKWFNIPNLVLCSLGASRISETFLTPFKCSRMDRLTARRAVTDQLWLFLTLAANAKAAVLIDFLNNGKACGNSIGA